MAKSPLRLLCIALPMLTASSVWAQASVPDIPNNVVAIGSYWVFYNVHASDLSGPFTPAGASLDVKNLTTVYFAYQRRLSTHFVVELAGGIPPVTKSTGKGPAAVGSVPFNGQVISTARWLAPSALIKYVFFDDSHVFRPYIGAGINYVDFYDRDSTPAGNAAAGGPTKIELSSSWGPAGTVGVSMALPHYWGIALSYSASRVHSDLRSITGDVVRTSSIGFNPQAIVLAATYAFGK
jgi:outer membrane protein